MESGSAERPPEDAGIPMRNRRFKTKGYSRNYLESFVHNPQFFVTLSVPDDDEDNLCTLIVSLMQKGRRQLKHEGVGMLSVGRHLLLVVDRRLYKVHLICYYSHYVLV